MKTNPLVVMEKQNFVMAPTVDHAQQLSRGPNPMTWDAFYVLVHCTPLVAWLHPAE